jgi:hypothetical protein
MVRLLGGGRHPSTRCNNHEILPSRWGCQATSRELRIPSGAGLRARPYQRLAKTLLFVVTLRPSEAILETIGFKIRSNMIDNRGMICCRWLGGSSGKITGAWSSSLVVDGIQTQGGSWEGRKPLCGNCREGNSAGNVDRR